MVGMVYSHTYGVYIFLYLRDFDYGYHLFYRKPHKVLFGNSAKMNLHTLYTPEN